MRITIIQPETIWEDKKANFADIERIISGIPLNSDLVVLPEMFSTGFTLSARKLAEEGEGETLQWMRSTASKGEFALCGSYIVKYGDSYFNQFTLVTRNGGYHIYNKRHLFSMAGENKIYTAGTDRKVIYLNGVRFLPLVCYDLRFPVWSRNRNDYDAIIYVASWPDVRREAWRSLIRARAIENQCYVIAVNRTGYDDEGLRYAGDSAIFDPSGKMMCSVEEYRQGFETADISIADLNKFREKFPFWKDSDSFEIR
jgi:omega-amidase